MAKFCGVGIGIGVACVDGQGRILVGRRLGSHGAGTFALPGGHLELNETWEECARREVFEETGLTLAPGAMPHVFTSNSRMPDDKHYVTLVLLGRVPEGAEPQNLEPTKCDGWSYATWTELRASNDPMFLPLRHLVDSAEAPVWDEAKSSSTAQLWRGSATHFAAALAGAAAAVLTVAMIRGKSVHY